MVSSPCPLTRTTVLRTGHWCPPRWEQLSLPGDSRPSGALPAPCGFSETSLALPPVQPRRCPHPQLPPTAHSILSCPVTGSRSGSLLLAVRGGFLPDLAPGCHTLGIHVSLLCPSWTRSPRFLRVSPGQVGALPGLEVIRCHFLLFISLFFFRNLSGICSSLGPSHFLAHLIFISGKCSFSLLPLLFLLLELLASV